MEDDPLILSIKFVRKYQYQTRTYIDNLVYAVTDDIEKGFRELKANIINSTSSRRIIYKEINPNLSVHSECEAKTHVSEHY